MDKIFESIKHLKPRSEKELNKIHKNKTNRELFRLWQTGLRDHAEDIQIFLTLKRRKAKSELYQIQGTTWYDIWKAQLNEDKINNNMEKINEQEQVYSEAHAKELLNVQMNYNKQLQDLNNTLAKQKSDLAVKHMKLMQAQNQTAQPVQPQQNTNQPNQTGNVDTTGAPVNAQGNPPQNEGIDILKIKEKISEELTFNTGDIDDFNEWTVISINGEEKTIKEIEHYSNNKILHFTDGTEMAASELKNKKVKFVRELEYWEQEELDGTKEKKSKVKKKIQDLRYQIADLLSEKESILALYQSPTHEDAEGEIENFLGEIGGEAANILGGGNVNTHELIRDLNKIGIKSNDAKRMIETYYEYYPEYNTKNKEHRKISYEKAQKIQEKIDDILAKIKEFESKLDKWEIDESVNESTFKILDVDTNEIQSLKDYMDAENISYSEDEDGSSITFDENKLESEWKDFVLDIPKDDIDIVSTDELTDEDWDNDPYDMTVHSPDNDYYNNEDEVFYLKVTDGNTEFTGKIYKLFDEGDWRAKVVDGNSDSFEQLNYDPEYDQIDIIAFLRDNYDDAEIIDQKEFESHVDEATKLEPNLGGKIDMKTHKILKKGENKNDKMKQYEKEVTESKQVRISPLDDFLEELNEGILKFNDGEEFDTSGELRTEERNDGWYILGKGHLIPVKSQKEGNTIISKMKKTNQIIKRHPVKNES